LFGIERVPRLVDGPEQLDPTLGEHGEGRVAVAESAGRARHPARTDAPERLARHSSHP
jgi:hypothetical protein